MFLSLREMQRPIKNLPLLKKGLPNLNSNKISLTIVFYSLPLNKSTLISKVTTIPMLISNNPIAI